MNPTLHIEENQDAGRKIFRLEGRLDTASASFLEKKLEECFSAHIKKVLLDFSKVSYLSSAGMRVLLAATKKWKTVDGAVLLFSLCPELMELIKMAGFDRILHIFSSEKEAHDHL